VIWEYRARIGTVLAGLFVATAPAAFAINLIVAFLPAGGAGPPVQQGDQGHLFKPVPVALAFIVGGS
jgi:undecaprenyl-diphosphatase